MKASYEETNPTGNAGPIQPPPISERKLKANRENAKKSTGPRTPKGKSYSRRNAVKHGLFMSLESSFLPGENSDEYQYLMDQLRREYRPSDIREDLEVQLIALSWWRLKRAWCYENAANHVGFRDSGMRELREQRESWEKKKEEEEAAVHELEILCDEINPTGMTPSELQQKIFAIMPFLEGLWPTIEARAELRVTRPPCSEILRNESAEQRAMTLAVFKVQEGIGFIKAMQECRATIGLEIATVQHVIPNAESLDKILRYQAAIERTLSQAQDRLERLQQRRKAESAYLPPPAKRPAKSSGAQTHGTWSTADRN